MKILKTFAKKGWRGQKIDFPLLADPKSDMIKAFGILNEKHKKGHKWHGVPHPYIFIADAKGRIIGKMSEKRYQDRPTAQAVLESLKEAKKK